ncbi:MAG: BlaI/MecI/CopY family transcriptional regulator [Eubacteriales bacterium]|jgi:BlaI family penicillinase repressor|nr:BlaI/MecI/CopY family transcriptional regulator [Clostridiales bacterium]
MRRVKISDAEWEIMKALWSNTSDRGMTLGEIVRALDENNMWSYTTIRTLLVRLISKGAVAADRTSGVYRYSTVLSKEECIANEVKSFVSRIFDNSPSQYIAALVRDGNLDEHEIKEIKKILAEIDKE